MITGVIEGFYGRAWTQDERFRIMDWTADAGMNAFIYGPKDDVHIRARWRFPYEAGDLAAIADLARGAHDRGLRFWGAIAPSLDITYSDPADRAALKARLDQWIAIGVTEVVLLYDDIPSVLPAADRAHFADFASAQADVANDMAAHMAASGGRIIFCPTEYCGRMAGGDPEASPYLQVLGRALAPEIEVFWTGPEIVSLIVTVDHLQAVGRVLQRKPLFWDNYHANDYDVRRVMIGPLAGREPRVRDHVSGWITNPNNEAEANYLALATTGQFLETGGTDVDTVLAAWQPRFRKAFSDGAELTGDELRLLVDLFWGPFDLGPETGALLGRLAGYLQTGRPDPKAPEWQALLADTHAFRTRVSALFTALTELENRDLFHTFHPYIWEAQEEMMNLCAYLDWLATGPAPDAPVPEADLVPNTYRRGLGSEIQRILPRKGTLT